jgi:SAM-dependent methyltransferase
MKVDETILGKDQVDSSELEHMSNITYSVIAAEYYDKRHKTCRAFDFLDERIINLYQSRYSLFKGGNSYLEVGAGRAVVLKRMLPPNSDIVIGDLCAEMARLAFPLPNNMIYRDFSAFNIPFSNDSFNGVFAFLADSYNIERFYKEALRTIRPGGFLLVTCPSVLWARTLRQGEGESLHYARFPTLNGEVLQIPSITRGKEEYNELLINVGFKQVSYEEFCLPTNYPPDCIPDTIYIPARRLHVEVSQLPLVIAVLGFK